MNFTTILDSPFGPLTLVSDGAAIVALAFDGRVESARLQGPFVEDDDAQPFERARRELREYFAGRRTQFGIPLAPCGTPFQQRVWEALRRIPFGATSSYRDIARAVGAPDAVRAVGAANGRNPIAIVVPCHRVIGSDGTLTGYAGGLDRKRALLELEGAAAWSSEKQRQLL
jgi:methylated-DNA-[protein]-cysteine S-methyltransferase